MIGGKCSEGYQKVSHGVSHSYESLIQWRESIVNKIKENAQKGKEQVYALPSNAKAHLHERLNSLNTSINEKASQAKNTINEKASQAKNKVTESTY